VVCYTADTEKQNKEDAEMQKEEIDRWSEDDRIRMCKDMLDGSGSDPRTEYRYRSLVEQARAYKLTEEDVGRYLLNEFVIMVSRYEKAIDEKRELKSELNTLKKCSYLAKVASGKIKPAYKKNVETKVLVDMKADGCTYKEIAEVYGIHKSTVCRRIKQYREENKE
jgi:hypothetical protein